MVVLSSLTEELKAEGQADPTLDASTLDRALIARLIESPPADYPQAPVQYLLGCYDRTAAELRQAASNPDVQAAVTAARDLIINYLGLALFAGVVPQSPAQAARGALQLLDSLLLRHGLPHTALAAAMAASVGGGGGVMAAAGVVSMPAGCLEELVARHEADEGLAEAAVAMVVELSRQVSRISPLGDPTPHLSTLAHLMSMEPLARAATSARQWLPDLRVATGRAAVLPGACWLGPFFNISPIPDDQVQGVPPQEPGVLQHCFSQLEARRPGDVASAQSGLRLATRNITGQLHGIVQTLLKTKSTKAAMVRWLAGVINGNSGRAKLQIDNNAVATDGFFANLSLVLLKLCGPFLDPSSPLFWKRVDPAFVAAGGAPASTAGSTAGGPLLDYSGETRLAATREEEAAWRERLASNAAASSTGGGAGSDPTIAGSPKGGAAGGGDDPGGFHFICSAFFLTAHALHLGPVRSMTEMAELTHQLREMQAYLPRFEAEVQAAAANPGIRAVAEMRLKQFKADMDNVQGRVMAFQTVLLDPALVGELLAFYRLMASWLTRLACPAAAGGSLVLPLPDPAPPEFTCLPEFFVEDMCDALLFVGRVAPQLLGAAGGGARLEEMALFFTAAMASPKHIRSAYLRSKLSEVLEQWLPEADDDEGGPFARGRRRPAAGADLSSLFNCHPTIVAHLAPVLLRLYNDIEHTERPGAFYFKFNMRVTIANILKYLWAQPQHRSTWLSYVRSEGSRGESERFVNMLLNDATYLLDECLAKLRAIREAEGRQADAAAWAATPQQERQELLNALQHNGQQLAALLRSATSVIDTLNFVTEEADTTATLLLPHMVGRLAATLNYFLKYLTGPERKQLRISNPDKYNFRPKELLQGLLTVYLHVAAHDRAGVFAEAVGQDTRSFRPDMFMEAANVLSSFGLLSEPDRVRLEMLAQRAVAAGSAAEEADEEAGGDVPEEFLCEIMATVMKDPVRLPSGKVVDRPSILRHLLTDPKDPFSRQPLTEDQLHTDEALAQRITEWRRERRAAAAAGAGAGGAAPMQTE